MSITGEKITLRHGELSFSAIRYGYHDSNPSAVVCLHGFPDNLHSFAHQLEALLAADLQVITPAMRGYQTSSIPKDKNFTIEAMAEDLRAWLDQLNIRQAHLVGHDWGAAVAYAAASLFPERLLSITTIAVPHPARLLSIGLRKAPIQLLKSWYVLFNQLPFIASSLSRRNQFWFFKFLWRKWSPGYQVSKQQWRVLCESFSQAGVCDAMLAYYRDNSSPSHLLGLNKTLMNTISCIDVPNLAITGAQDGCIDTNAFEYSMLEEDHPKGLSLARIENAGHFCHQEEPEQVNLLLTQWMAEHS